MEKELTQEEKARMFFESIGIDLEDFNKRSVEATKDYENIEVHTFQTEFELVKKHFTPDMITYFAVQRNHQLQEMVANIESFNRQQEQQMEEETKSSLILPNNNLILPSS